MRVTPPPSNVTLPPPSITVLRSVGTSIGDVTADRDRVGAAAERDDVAAPDRGAQCGLGAAARRSVADAG